MALVELLLDLSKLSCYFEETSNFICSVTVQHQIICDVYTFGYKIKSKCTVEVKGDDTGILPCVQFIENHIL